MSALITIIHVIVCIVLILVVLLQSGKGADIGAAFGGGSSQTLFGATGATTFLTKATTAAAVIFMLTSLTLSFMSAKSRNRSIVPETVAPQAPIEQTLPGTSKPMDTATDTAAPATDAATPEAGAEAAAPSQPENTEATQ